MINDLYKAFILCHKLTEYSNYKINFSAINIHSKYLLIRQAKFSIAFLFHDLEALQSQEFWLHSLRVQKMSNARAKIKPQHRCPIRGFYFCDKAEGGQNNSFAKPPIYDLPADLYNLCLKLFLKGFEKPGFLVKIEAEGFLKPEFRWFRMRILKFQQRKYWPKGHYFKVPSTGY